VVKQNRSLSRGLRILRVFNEAPTPSLAEIASAVELDKTTCRRFLLTLQEEGYVEFDEVSKRYQVRPLVIELGYAALGSLTAPRLARPYMQDLANEVGGAVNLATLEGDEIVLVARAVADVEKKKLITMNLHVGMHLPAHCTAMGRMLIGVTHTNVRQFVSSMRLEKLAPSTLISRPQLTAAIGEAVRSGYAVVEDQLSPGHGAIAVAFNGGKGQHYAMAVSVSTGEFPRVRLERDVLPLLQKVQAKLNRLMSMAD
jgi:IclR family pca regulon transcriptional regulator